MILKPLKILAAILCLLGASTAYAQSGPLRILTIGDSLMAWHNLSKQAIPQNLARELGQSVKSRAVGGARILYALPLTGAMGMSIPKQYHRGKWDWVVVNGGGNDLWLGCGCRACDTTMRRMISPDGRRGRIPGLVNTLRKSGARVIYVGYLRSPGVGSAIDHCRDEGNEFDRRINNLANLDKDIHFLSLANLVPYGDKSYHFDDLIHPSTKATAIIAKMIADIIKSEPR